MKITIRLVFIHSFQSSLDFVYFDEQPEWVGDGIVTLYVSPTHRVVTQYFRPRY